MLVVDHVTRDYPSRRALDDVSFSLAPGELCAIVGENGAGKTTLLRILATLDTPTRGKVRIRGAESGAASRRHVGYLGQDSGLYDSLTIRENLAFAARFFGREADVDAFPLGLDASRLARSLSRGERQRVALARSLLCGDVLVLDEPTTALDEEGVAWVAEQLRGNQGIVATHDPRVLKSCNRTIRLRQGRISP